MGMGVNSLRSLPFDQSIHKPYHTLSSQNHPAYLSCPEGGGALADVRQVTLPSLGTRVGIQTQGMIQGSRHLNFKISIFSKFKKRN
jgi:hypothetical protein